MVDAVAIINICKLDLKKKLLKVAEINVPHEIADTTI